VFNFGIPPPPPPPISEETVSSVSHELLTMWLLEHPKSSMQGLAEELLKEFEIIKKSAGCGR